MSAELDLTGVLCPMTWVRTRLALEDLDPGEPLESVPRSAREDGHEVAERGEIVSILKR